MSIIEYNVLVLFSTTEQKMQRGNTRSVVAREDANDVIRLLSRFNEEIDQGRKGGNIPVFLEHISDDANREAHCKTAKLVKKLATHLANRYDAPRANGNGTKR